jgi:hypothetical protein
MFSANVARRPEHDHLGLRLGERLAGSVSCMHVVEHVGLGRYGDPLDANGDLQAIKELKCVLWPGGVLYFVVPTGVRRL